MTKLDFNNVKMKDIDGKAIIVKPQNSTGNVFNRNYDKNLLAFVIHDEAVYDFTTDEKGKWVENEVPVVKLDTAHSKIEYLAGCFVENMYQRYGGSHEDKIIGEPAIALLQALKLYLQSYQLFIFDAELTDEAKILGGVIESTSTTSTTTSTTTVKPTTTTTTTTTTTAKSE